MGNTDTQDSPRPGLGGSQHLPPYSILCDSPGSPHPNGFSLPGLPGLPWDSRVGVPKSRQLGLPGLWGRITSCAELRLQRGLKQSCRPSRELSNGMSHVARSQVNQVDSRLFLVRSQTGNLTPGFDSRFWLPAFLLAVTSVLDVQMSNASPF
jgi:hypothetical protein